MGHTSGSMEDSGAAGDLNCGGLVQEIQRRILVYFLELVLRNFGEECGWFLLLSKEFT